MGVNDFIKVGSRIKALRKAKNLTQREVATRLEIPFSTYSNYENDNREPTMSTLQAISGILDCSVDYLVGHVPEPHMYSIPAHFSESLGGNAKGTGYAEQKEKPAPEGKPVAPEIAKLIELIQDFSPEEAKKLSDYIDFLIYQDNNGEDGDTE